MQTLFPDIWNILHDGGVERFVGEVPGDVQVFVGIECVRERFPDDGDGFVISLTKCTRLSRRLYGAEDAVTDLASIASESSTMLSSEMHGKVCRSFVDSGVLEIQCGGGSNLLDSGRAISLDELRMVAQEYWDDWESKSKPGR